MLMTQCHVKTQFRITIKFTEQYYCSVILKIIHFRIKNRTAMVHKKICIWTATDLRGSKCDTISLESQVHAKKALVLSFHGAAGTGKNYISNFITKSLFKLGWKSKNVHFFSGRVHFKADSKSEINKDNLLQWLGEKVKACPKQLFIFDEVHYMPESILNTIKPVLDYREIVDGADYRNAIFIFISNTGTTIINDHYKEIVKTGKRREYIELKDFEKLIFKGGFYHSEAIDSNLIDHYIPFLPMEEEHVIECIKDAFQEREIESPHQEYINLVLEELLWISDGPRPISKTGCKAVSAKVGIISMKYYKTGVDFPKEDL